MDDSLLLFGLVVLILIAVGVYLSVSEFKDMSDHPEDYRSDDANIEIKK